MEETEVMNLSGLIDAVHCMIDLVVITAGGRNILSHYRKSSTLISSVLAAKLRQLVSVG